MQFRVIVVTDTQTHTNKQTHRHDRLQYTAPLSLVHSVKIQNRDKYFKYLFEILVFQILHKCDHKKFTTVLNNNQRRTSNCRHALHTCEMCQDSRDCSQDAHRCV